MSTITPTAAAEEHAIHELGGDYADLAKALGGHGERVTEPAEIKPAIARALAQNAQGRPALIEVITKEEPRMAKKLAQAVGLRRRYADLRPLRPAASALSALGVG